MNTVNDVMEFFRESQAVIDQKFMAGYIDADTALDREEKLAKYCEALIDRINEKEGA